METQIIDDKAVIGAVTDGARFSAVMHHMIVSIREPNFWGRLADDLYALGEYVQKLSTHMVVQIPSSSPQRPQLLSLPAIQRAKSLMGRIQSHRELPRRRRASKRKS